MCIRDRKVGVLRDTVFFLHPNVFGRSLPTCRQTRRHVGHEAVDESCGQSQEIKDVNDQQMAPQRFFLFFVHFRFAEYVMEVFDLFLTSGEAKIVKNFCKTNNFYRFSINSYRFKGILRKNTRNGVSHYAKKSTDLSVLSSGSNGARTRDLSRVRRTLIPAELCFHNYAMRITGLEPARLLTIEPKSIASATSAISAY